MDKINKIIIMVLMTLTLMNVTYAPNPVLETPDFQTSEYFNDIGITKIMNLQLGGFEGLVGAFIGVIIMMLISFRYDDWAKLLAPIYLILVNLGIVVNVLVLLGALIWFAIGMWKESSLVIAKLGGIVQDTVSITKEYGTDIKGLSTKNRALKRLAIRTNVDAELDKLKSGGFNIDKITSKAKKVDLAHRQALKENVAMTDVNTKNKESFLLGASAQIGKQFVNNPDKVSYSSPTQFWEDYMKKRKKNEGNSISINTTDLSGGNNK